MKIDIQLLLYFLTTTGSLIAIAWKFGGRFSKVETSIEFLKDGLKDLKVDIDNVRTQAFQTHSPVSLTEKGAVLLKDSGIKDYIDSNKGVLIKIFKDGGKTSTAYDIQENVFSYFDKFEFPEEVEQKMKKYAFEQGISLDIIRRVGAIHFRDELLGECGFSPKDLDINKK